MSDEKNSIEVDRTGEAAGNRGLSPVVLSGEVLHEPAWLDAQGDLGF